METLRIEVFASDFAVPVYGNETKIKHFVGTDAEVVRIIQAILNATVTNHPYDSKNFDVDGARHRLQADDTDLVAVGHFIRDYPKENITYSTSIYSDRLCCIVQKAGRISSSVLPLIVFQPSEWIGLLFGICACAGIWFVIRWLCNGLQAKLQPALANFSVVGVFVDTLVVMMSAPMRRRPAFQPERVYVISLCLVSIVLIAYFISFLATLFVHPIYYRDMQTLSELDASGMRIKVLFQVTMTDLFSAGTVLDQRVDLVRTNASLLGTLAQHGGFAAARRSSTFYLAYRYWFLTNRLHAIPECPRTYQMAYIVRRHSPYLKAINRVLSQLLAGGLIDKWTDDMKYNTTMDNIRIYGAQTTEPYRVFTLGDLQFPFLMWFVGIGLAGLVLAAELIARRMNQRRNVVYLP